MDDDKQMRFVRVFGKHLLLPSVKPMDTCLSCIDGNVTPISSAVQI